MSTPAASVAGACAGRHPRRPQGVGKLSWLSIIGLLACGGKTHAPAPAASNSGTGAEHSHVVLREAGAASPDARSAGMQGDAGQVGPGAPAPGTCKSDADCASASPSLPHCNLLSGRCAQCNADTDCKPGELCNGGACHAGKNCINSRDCDQGEVCDETRALCVQCVSSADCSAGVCISSICRPSCVSDKECTPIGLLCDTTAFACVECVRAADCPSDRFCRAGSCMPDICAPGYSACVDQGRAVTTCNADGSSLLMASCGRGTACKQSSGNAACEDLPCAPSVMLLLDNSGSMCAEFGGQSRWSALRSVMTDPAGPVHRNASSVAIGVLVYGGNEDLNLLLSGGNPAITTPPAQCADAGVTLGPYDAGVCAMFKTVAPAIDNAAAIDAVLPQREATVGLLSIPDKATAAAVDMLLAMSGSVPGYILVLTDGAPASACVGGSGGDGTAEQQELIATVDRGAASGITTLVVNLETGSPSLQAYLDQVARHGDPVSSSAHAFTASSAGELAALFEQVFQRAATCH